MPFPQRPDHAVPPKSTNHFNVAPIDVLSDEEDKDKHMQLTLAEVKALRRQEQESPRDREGEVDLFAPIPGAPRPQPKARPQFAPARSQARTCARDLAGPGASWEERGQEPAQQEQIRWAKPKPKPKPEAKRMPKPPPEPQASWAPGRPPPPPPPRHSPRLEHQQQQQRQQQQQQQQRQQQQQQQEKQRKKPPLPPAPRLKPQQLLKPRIGQAPQAPGHSSSASSNPFREHESAASSNPFSGHGSAASSNPFSGHGSAASSNPFWGPGSSAIVGGPTVTTRIVRSAPAAEANWEVETDGGSGGHPMNDASSPASVEFVGGSAASGLGRGPQRGSGGSLQLRSRSRSRSRSRGARSRPTRSNSKAGGRPNPEATRRRCPPPPAPRVAAPSVVLKSRDEVEQTAGSRGGEFTQMLQAMLHGGSAPARQPDRRETRRRSGEEVPTRDWQLPSTRASSSHKRVSAEEWDQIEYEEDEEEQLVRPARPPASKKEWWVSVDDVGFTQETIGKKFQDGREFEDLIQGLLDGRISLEEDFLCFPIVRVGGDLLSANNRRLHCVKEYQKRLGPGSSVKIRIKEKGAVTKHCANILKHKYNTKDMHKVRIR